MMRNITRNDVAKIAYAGKIISQNLERGRTWTAMRLAAELTEGLYPDAEGYLEICIRDMKRQATKKEQENALHTVSGSALKKAENAANSLRDFLFPVGTAIADALLHLLKKLHRLLLTDDRHRAMKDSISNLIRALMEMEVDPEE